MIILTRKKCTNKRSLKRENTKQLSIVNRSEDNLSKKNR